MTKRKLNKRRLAAIARWLEAGAPHKKGNLGRKVIGFNMSHVETTTDCGSICCIAGAAEQFFGDPGEGHFSDQCADDLLCLTSDQAKALFMPAGWITDAGQYTPAWAARVIRKLISTGTVDWEGTRQVKA